MRVPGTVVCFEKPQKTLKMCEVGNATFPYLVQVKECQFFTPDMVISLFHCHSIIAGSVKKQ
jgi:hypothetical protein